MVNGQKNVTVLIALNLSAAFNTVDHSVLLSTLQANFRVHEIALEWFKNDLAPRGMKVKVGKAYSDKKELTFSVPQGSYAGANLFNMYSSTIKKE